jgi:large repetitive protein
VTVTPSAIFVGEMTVTYEITDEDGLTDTGEVIIAVQPVPNRSPIASDDAASVVNGGSVTVPIAFNDSDPDGDSLVYRLVSGATSALGTATLQANSLVFDAAPGQAGVATIGYSVSDGAATATAEVRVTVLECAAAPPNAPDVSLRTGYQQPIAIDLGAYAANGEIVDVGAPLGAPSGVYTPPAGENGNVSFTYTVRNSCRVQDTGTVVIDVNQDPVGTARSFEIGRRATLSIPVDQLATDLEALTITALESQPEWITIAGGASIEVNPAGRAGRADFVAVVSDPGGLIVRVPISVVLVNLAPVANADTYTNLPTNGALVLDVLTNDSDPDQDDTIALQSVPASVTFANGVTVPLEVLGNDRLRLNIAAANGTPTGAAVFTYTVVDSQGLPSQPATVTVTVNSPPIAPTVDTTVTVGVPLQVPIPATDPDNQPLVFTLLDTDPRLTITNDGLNLTITAGASAQGNDIALRYRVTDPLGAATDGVLNVSVEPVRPPETQPVEVTLTAGTSASVRIPATNPDGGGDPTITIEGTLDPLDISIAGLDVTIDAPDGSEGTYRLQYTATGPGGSTTDDLTITVQPPP